MSDRPLRLRRRPALRVAADVTLPLFVVAGLLAPAVVTSVSTPVVVLRAEPDRIPVIHVQPFEDLAAGSCFADPPLHMGPVSLQGKLTNEGALRSRMTAAVSRCDDDWFGGVAVTVRIDANGSIRDVRAAAGGDGRMSTCVIRNVMHDGHVEAHGPGELTIGYFMGPRAL